MVTVKARVAQFAKDEMSVRPSSLACLQASGTGFTGVTGEISEDGFWVVARYKILAKGEDN